MKVTYQANYKETLDIKTGELVNKRDGGMVLISGLEKEESKLDAVADHIEANGYKTDRYHEFEFINIYVPVDDADKKNHVKQLYKEWKGKLK